MSKVALTVRGKTCMWHYTACWHIRANITGVTVSRKLFHEIRADEIWLSNPSLLHSYVL
jgi:hypothetical protein